MQHLKKHNIPIALATSSTKESSELKIQKWGHIFDLFDHKIYGGSDPEVVRGKPSPDIFLIAAKRFPDNPDNSKVRFVLEFAVFKKEIPCKANSFIYMYISIVPSL